MIPHGARDHYYLVLPFVASSSHLGSEVTYEQYRDPFATLGFLLLLRGLLELGTNRLPALDVFSEIPPSRL